jgi:hypothetical protein
MLKLFFLNCEHYGLKHIFHDFPFHKPKNKKTHIKTLCNFLKSKIKLEIL